MCKESFDSWIWSLTMPAYLSPQCPSIFINVGKLNDESGFEYQDLFVRTRGYSLFVCNNQMTH